MPNDPAYLGIDVQVKREAFYAALDDEGHMVSSGCLDASREDSLIRIMSGLIKKHGEVHVGIDAPRCFLLAPRLWYWEGAKLRWRPKGAKHAGYGRHCEVVISAHGLANPQWTPLETSSQEYSWIRYGVSLFEMLDQYDSVHEVFPTASYALLANAPDVRAEIDFTAFSKGAKDALDAVVAAVTVREFIAGRGGAVGGGDGMGQIVLPRPISNPIKEVLEWPAEPIHSSAQ